MKIDIIELVKRRKTRKYFKYEREDHIRRFYKTKQKEITLVIFDVSENDEVLKTKENQDSEL